MLFSKIVSFVSPCTMSAQSVTKYIKLITDAQKLLTPNAFNDQGGISAVHTKSQQELKNNKLAFYLFVKASKLGVSFHPHLNLGEFYYSGLDGATTKDISKAAHHYYEAWKMVNKKMVKAKSPSNEFEQLLLNFSGVLEDVDVEDKRILDHQEAIRLSKRLSKHSNHPTFKVFGHYIQALIYLRLSKRAESYVQYQKCVDYKEDDRISYITKIMISKAEEMLATMDITAHGFIEQMENHQPFGGGEADGAYFRNRDRFGKERKKLLNENPEHKSQQMSGIGDLCDGTKVHKVNVIRGKMGSNGEGAKSKNVLVTADETLKTVTMATGKSAERTCAFCGVVQLNMMRCSRCKQVHYCSGECQKSHWKEHKRQCKKLKKPISTPFI